MLSTLRAPEAGDARIDETLADTLTALVGRIASTYRLAALLTARHIKEAAAVRPGRTVASPGTDDAVVRTVDIFDRVLWPIGREAADFAA